MGPYSTVELPKASEEESKIDETESNKDEKEYQEDEDDLLTHNHRGSTTTDKNRQTEVI